MKKVTKAMQKNFLKIVLSKEMDFFNDILIEWGYEPKTKNLNNIEYVIPLVKDKKLPYLEISIYPLTNDVNITIDYLPVKPERIIPLKRSNSALEGLEIISKHLEFTNRLKDEQGIYNYFINLGNTSKENNIEA